MCAITTMRVSSCSVVTLPLLALLSAWLVTVAEGAIDCHYCGPRQLCQLPYDTKLFHVQKVKCEKACMKFDGERDGNRVVIRDCAQPEHYDNMNTCVDDFDYHGAKGQLCPCNAPDCNTAGATYASIAVVAVSTIFAAIVARMV